MLSLLVNLIVIMLVIGVAWWLIDYIPLPEPLAKIARVLVIVLGALAIIYLLLGLSGHAPVLPRP